MSSERHVKLFRNGRNQAVRIPREFELPGNEAVIHREGNRLVIEPLEKPSLLRVLESLQPLVEELPSVDDPPPRDVEL